MVDDLPATGVPRVTERPTAETVKRFSEETLGLLAQELERGRSEVLTNYLAAMARFHRYSSTNTLLIYSQRPDATRVAGYHTWHDMGRFVRKGEKGLLIVAPIVPKTSEREAAPQRDASSPTARETSAPVGFRAAYVFDISQTEGRPLPDFAKTTGDPAHFIDRLKMLIREQGVTVEFNPSIAPAHGASSGGRIEILPGLSPAEEFSTLVHEFAHERLHHGHDRHAFTKTVRETQAEAVAFVVSRAVGLDATRASADYIALYQGDAQTLAESLAAIQRTASRILENLLPERREFTSTGERPVEADRPHGEITPYHDIGERAGNSLERIEPPAMER